MILIFSNVNYSYSTKACFFYSNTDNLQHDIALTKTYTTTLIVITITVGIFGKTTQVETQTPVIDFQLPILARMVMKLLIYLVKEEFFRDKNHIDIHGIFLEIYSGSEECETDITTESFQATLKLKENKAFVSKIIFGSRKRL